MKINFSPINYQTFGTNIRKVRANKQGEVASSNERRFYDSDFDILLYENTTSFFRYDLNKAYKKGVTLKFPYINSWDGFRKTIVEHFKNAPKVNIYDFASSDGSEAYSLILSLIDELGEKASDKFFPIQAFDIDSSVVQTAKKGEIPCNIDDIGRFDKNLYNLSQNEYFDFSQSDKELVFVANDSLKKKVQFQESDILSEIDKIEPSNSLVLCRNFWPYLDKDYRNKAFEKLCEKLDETSLIVVGCFDNSTLHLSFEKYGFVDICPFVYKKMSNNSF